MSGDHFHVHGLHDHAVEHAAHSNEGNSSRMAVYTAVLATIGAIFSYMGGATQNDAAMLKNDAAIKKTEASNQWNYYQAKSQKSNLAKFAVLVVPEEEKEKQKKEIERYEREKEEIKVEAEKLEKASTHFDELSEHSMHKHHRWAMATTFIQIGIALAAIALITKKRWLEIAMGVASASGLITGITALFM